MTVTTNGDYSTNVATLTDHPGTYYWFASYSGDANNSSAETGCSDATEQVVVKKATPNSRPTRPPPRSSARTSPTSRPSPGLVSPAPAPVTFELFKGANCAAGQQGRRSTLTATDDPVGANGDYTRRRSTPPPPAPAPTTGSPTTPATPTTTPSTAPASTTARTRRSKKRPRTEHQRDRHRDRRPEHLRHATLARPGQPANSRRRHLRALQGRRLLGRQTERRPDRRHPGHGQRQRRLQLGRLQHRHLRRRLLPLDRPLLRRRQQQRRRRRLPGQGREHDGRKSDPELKTNATASAIVGENISDTATLSELVSPPTRRRHLRPLQGRRLRRAPKSAAPRPPPRPRSTPTATTPRPTSTPPPPAPAPTTGSPTTPATPTTKPPTAPASTTARTRRSKKRPRTLDQRDHDRDRRREHLRRRDPAGLVSPTGAGAVTFDLYKGADCSGAKLNGALDPATPATVTANGNYTSQSFDTTATGAGAYHWIAHYSGDANNKAVDGACLDTGENTTVEKASPQITTNAGPGTVLGGQVSDTAHLSGGVNPTGSITFRLYNNPNCAGTPAAERHQQLGERQRRLRLPAGHPGRRRRLLLGRDLLRRRQQQSALRPAARMPPRR